MKCKLQTGKYKVIELDLGIKELVCFIFLLRMLFGII